MVFLFWNIQKKHFFFDTIAHIVKEESVDVAFFAEFPTGNESVLEIELKKVDGEFSYIQDITKRKICVFSRLSRPVFSPKEDKKRYSIFEFKDIIKDKRFNIVACHLEDRINNSIDALCEKAGDFRMEIEEYENRSGCENTIVCGDFNMNPFEKGMFFASKLNAVMSKKIASNVRRTVNGKDYRFFYNPMWGHLGDNGKSGVPGSHYFNPSKIDQLYWNLFDQVIIRPTVIPDFDETELKVLKGGLSYNLLTCNGIVDDKNYSDHLPIKFKIQ